MSFISLRTFLSRLYFQEASDPQPYEPDAASEPFRCVSLTFNAFPRPKPPQDGPGDFSPRLFIFPLLGWNNIGVFVLGQPDGIHHPDHR